jgi:hypothetical protein
MSILVGLICRSSMAILIFLLISMYQLELKRIIRLYVVGREGKLKVLPVWIIGTVGIFLMQTIFFYFDIYKIIAKKLN